MGVSKNVICHKPFSKPSICSSVFLLQLRETIQLVLGNEMRVDVMRILPGLRLQIARCKSAASLSLAFMKEGFLFLRVY